MEKLIAFNIYSRAPSGSYHTAVIGDEAKEVYLAADVERLREALSVAIELFQDECDPVSEPDSYRWLQQAQSLMDPGAGK